MNAKLSWAYRTTLGALGLLILSFIVWQLRREGGPLFFILSVQILPLLVFFPSLLQAKARAFIWLCFVILVYFIKGVLGVFKPAPDWMDMSLLMMSVVIFISAMLTGRWLKQNRL